MKKFFRHFQHNIFIVFGGTVLAVFALSAIAFTEPSQVPPGGNVPAPLNVSTAAQTKQGSIATNGVLTTPTLCLAGDCRSLWPAPTGDNDWSFNSIGGVTHIYSAVSGNVGVGTNIPAYRFDVTGDIRATGVIYANANNQRYFQGGDDAALYDINIANTMGIYGVQDSTQGHIKLGSNGPIISGVNGNVGIGIAAPSYRLDVQGGQINASGGICINGDCKTNWSSVGTNYWADDATANALFPVTLGRRVGLGITNPAAKLHLQDSQDGFIRMDRTGAANPTTLRMGTDGAFVISNNAVDALKIQNGSLYSSGNVYGWSILSGAMAVGFGELQKLVTDFPGVPVTGVGWYAATGKVGALIPQNQIFGIYGADPLVPQTPTTAHFYVQGDILSRDAGWTAPLRESSSGAGTISGNSLQWRWAGAGTSGKLRLKTDNTQFIIPTCSIGANGFCSDAIEPPADLNASPNFELRCPGNEVMRGLKWDSATGALSLICTR